MRFVRQPDHYPEKLSMRVEGSTERDFFIVGAKSLKPNTVVHHVMCHTVHWNASGVKSTEIALKVSTARLLKMKYAPPLTVLTRRSER